MKPDQITKELLESVVALHRENAQLRNRVELLELFVDSERRGRAGITLDDVRNSWRKAAGIAQQPTSERGAV